MSKSPKKKGDSPWQCSEQWRKRIEMEEFWQQAPGVYTKGNGLGLMSIHWRAEGEPGTPAPSSTQAAGSAVVQPCSLSHFVTADGLSETASSWRNPLGNSLRSSKKVLLRSEIEDTRRSRLQLEAEVDRLQKMLD
eukprot:gnl/TRDRNA2_/TRDRNA2_186079_c0_seq1.p1 gnl/TRDRNA2_/TRDRNA2_186079_c0~~gnl/TRDRNA2_/TRDRNA2_186079_c0_seq1.p1  ORF type:complete len:135 (-),score=30.12 gnl/TRDRNA2_/TRDRNA2_186079_c0_seq1:404-808(-)